MQDVRLEHDHGRRSVAASSHPRGTRRKTTSLLVVCGFSVAAWLVGIPAHAQDVAASRPVAFGFMAGGAGVTGQFRGSVSSGIAVGPEAQFSLLPGWLALRVDLLYLAVANYHGPCPNSCIFVQEDVNTQVVSGDFSVVARLNAHDARWSPYVVAGVTTHYVSDPLKTAVRTNPLGWQGGLGIEVRSSKHVFFTEVRYMTIAPGGVAPVVVGMRF